MDEINDVKESVEEVKGIMGKLKPLASKIAIAWKSKDYGGILKFTLGIILGLMSGYGISLI